MAQATAKWPVRNSSGEDLHVGNRVDRLDHFKVGGKIMAINRDRGWACVLVRWPGLDDVWSSPELLVPLGEAH